MVTVNDFEAMDNGKTQVTLNGGEACGIGLSLLAACEYILEAERFETGGMRIEPEKWQLICELKAGAEILACKAVECD